MAEQNPVVAFDKLALGHVFVRVGQAIPFVKLQWAEGRKSDYSENSMSYNVLDLSSFGLDFMPSCHEVVDLGAFGEYFRRRDPDLDRPLKVSEERRAATGLTGIPSDEDAMRVWLEARIREARAHGLDPLQALVKEVSVLHASMNRVIAGLNKVVMVLGIGGKA